MNMIVRPTTDDGMAGYDEFGQFVVSWREGDHTVSQFKKNLVNHVCQICQGTWEATAGSLKDQAYWSLIEAPVHESCLVRHQGFVERAAFHSAIVAARIRFTGLLPIANQYWPKSDAYSKKPWYETTLLDHPARLVVGRRKRVDELVVTARGEAKFDVEALRGAFSKEDVTKTFTEVEVLVHAWDDAHLVEYLKKVSSLLPKVVGP